MWGTKKECYCSRNFSFVFRYGDKVPVTSLGRIFSGIWIICGITLCSVLTASMTDVIQQVTLPKTPTLAAKVVITIGFVCYTNSYFFI